MKKPLTVYKASAGSGKTFRLAVEYISLLVQNPDNYRQILAVTFTNKATAEMKLRILSQLYGIAQGLDSADNYLKEVRRNVAFSNEELQGRTKDDVIRNRARAALMFLTHHYSDFRVLTIDAFFQVVLRNLARELDLTPNLHLSLNNREIEEKAIEDMIDDLQEGSSVLQWIGEYIQTRLDNNHSWRVFGDIKTFGYNIFEEFYQSNSKTLNERLSANGFFEHFRDNLRTLLDASRMAIVKPYQDMLELIRAENLDDTQWYAGSAASCDLTYIKKMSELRFSKQSDLFKALTAKTGSQRAERISNPDKWVSSKYKKCTEAQHLVKLAQTNLCATMDEAEQKRQVLASTFLSAQMTLAHINELRLLRAIEQAVNSQNKNEGRFMLSNTQHLLHTMINGSDTPFIFEKIGAQLRHIMIDEFQDTSTVQWQNFKVLLDNCLAQKGSRSLIVGDVKQSIYRWRSGDWNLLNNMKDDNLTLVEPIRQNWRSSQDIVLFNNTFFRIAKNLERKALAAAGVSQANQLAVAYNDKDTPQIPQKQYKGRVEILLIKRDGITKKDGERYRKSHIDSMVAHICKLLDQGVSPNKIAILTRSNEIILNIAEQFAHEEELRKRSVRLVSDEAFKLESSLSLRIIITALHLLAHPEDLISKSALVKNYQTYVLNNGEDDSETLIGLHERLSETLDNHLPLSFIKEFSRLSTMPLFELVDNLYRIFSLHRLQGQTAYICAFHDKLSQYLQDHTVGIDELTQYWDDTLRLEKVQAEDVDGIRIMTVHKSKGLEFDHVIIPFCDWKLEQQGVLWCSKPHPAPFDALPIVPVDYSERMLHTVYAEDYREEHFQNIVDNLNILYVAFTRAEKSLFVIGRKDDEKNCRSVLLEAVMKEMFNGQTTDLADEQNKYQIKKEYLHEKEDGNNLKYVYGAEEDEVYVVQTTPNKSENPHKQINVFEAKPEVKNIEIESFKSNAVFRQSNLSRRFRNNEENTNQYIQRGCILHQIFSTIHTLDDIENALSQLTIDGIIADNDETLGQLRRDIKQSLQLPEVSDWFSHRWTLFNECSILSLDSESGRVVEHRPDRVMTDGSKTIVVDFKFGKPHPEHLKQVAVYANLLKDMGKKNVRAYLWYVTDTRVEEVFAD